MARIIAVLINLISNNSYYYLIHTAASKRDTSVHALEAAKGKPVRSDAASVSSMAVLRHSVLFFIILLLKHT